MIAGRLMQRLLFTPQARVKFGDVCCPRTHLSAFTKFYNF